MSSKVLVTGAAGFIGHHLVKYILDKTDWSIHCPVSCRHKGDSQNLQEFNNDRTTFFYHDLNWPFSERNIEELGEVDYIIHAAAESHVDRSIQEPVPFIQNNVNVTLNLLEYARKIKPKVVIQVSTDEVYGPALNGFDHPEWSSVKPSNPYSASKAAQEAIAISYWRTYGVPVVITNTMNNFGPRQNPEKLIPYIIDNVKNDRRFFIHGKDGQFSSRYWTYVLNHADALLFILSQKVPIFPDAECPPRFNVVGEVEQNSLEMVNRIEAILGKKADWYAVDYHTTRPGHDLRYGLDGTKLASLGWRRPYEFGDALASTVESYLK
jgi:dTDP-glucose 4,6-dehydratase